MHTIIHGKALSLMLALCCLVGTLSIAGQDADGQPPAAVPAATQPAEEAGAAATATPAAADGKLSEEERDAAALADLEERIAKIRAEVEPKVPELTIREPLVAQTSLLVLARFHVLKPQLSAAMSSRWFNSYFEELDPAKIYFLQSDIDEFRGYEGRLWDERLNVNVRFAFAVYERLLERVREWVLFSIEALDQPQDYSVEESIPLNMKTAELSWCTTAEQQRDLWRKRIKNTLLADVIQKEERAKEGRKENTSRRRDVRFRNKKLLVSSYQYRHDVRAEDILGYFLNAFACLLDPHTNYMTPAAKKNFDIHMSNSLQGAGFVLTSRDFYTTIVEIIPGGPAARDGHLKPGDRILAVAQGENDEPVDVMDMPLDDVVAKIRGPKGTPVFLTIQPKASSTEYVLKLIRDEVVLKEAEPSSTIHEVETPAGKARIVSIYIPSFYCDMDARMKGDKENCRSTTNDTRRLIEKAREGGRIDGVIIDLRGNGGGYMDEACGLCGLFLDSGPVVQAKVDDSVEVLKDPTPGKAIYDGPLVVLVDKLSASASEITAACLQDRGRAVVCGDSSTHGKGSFQMPINLMEVKRMSDKAKLLGTDAEGKPREPGALKITNGRFYRINGVSTQSVGVVPDVVFPSFYDCMETGESNLPNALPGDVISATRYYHFEAFEEVVPQLVEHMKGYAEDNEAFRKYKEDVEHFRVLRQRKELPLEINARRAFIAEEKQCYDNLRRYQPERGSGEEKPERLKDDDDEDAKDDRKEIATVDVVLSATLEVMKELCSLLSSAK